MDKMKYYFLFVFVKYELSEYQYNIITYTVEVKYWKYDRLNFVCSLQWRSLNLTRIYKKNTNRRSNSQLFRYSLLHNIHYLQFVKVSTCLAFQTSALTNSPALLDKTVLTWATGSSHVLVLLDSQKATAVVPDMWWVCVIVRLLKLKISDETCSSVIFVFDFCCLYIWLHFFAYTCFAIPLCTTNVTATFFMFLFLLLLLQ